MAMFQLTTSRYIALLLMLALAASSCGQDRSTAPTNATRGLVNPPLLVYQRTGSDLGDHGAEIGTLRADGTQRAALIALRDQSADPEVTVSPRGRYLAVTTYGTPARLVVFDLWSGQTRAHASLGTPRTGTPSRPRIKWAPDESALAHLANGDARLVDLTSGRSSSVPGLADGFHTLQWSGSGRYLATCSLVNLSVWSRTGKRSPAARDSRSRRPHCGQWAWERNAIVFASERNMYTYEPSTGAMKARSGPPETPAGSWRIRPPQAGCPAQRDVTLIAGGRWALTRTGNWREITPGADCDRRLSPDGRVWARIEVDGTLVAGRGSNGTRVSARLASGVGGAFAFTRNSGYVIFQKDTELYVTDTAAKAVKRVADTTGALAVTDAVKAKGWAYSVRADRFVAVRADRRSLAVGDPTRGNSSTLKLPSGIELLSAMSVRISPDGWHVLIEPDSGGHLAVDLRSNRIVTVPELGEVYWPTELTASA